MRNCGLNVTQAPDEFYSLSFKIERKSANKLTHSSCSILKGPFGEAKQILET